MIDLTQVSEFYVSVITVIGASAGFIGGLIFVNIISR